MYSEQKEIRYNGKVVFERIVISSRFKRVPKLFKEGEACFLFLTKGAFQFRTPTNIISFTEGDAMLAKCGNYFLEEVAIKRSEDPGIISATGAFFYPDMVRSFFQTDLSILAFRDNFDAVKVNVEPLLKSFIDSINFLFDNPSIADENLIVTKLKELIILLSKTEKASSINKFVASLFTPTEHDFNEIIQQNLFSNLSLAELAYLCNSSLATFKRKFKEQYNISPAKYILKKRLEKATQLLQFKNKTIAEIAYECGFETTPNFNRSFRNQFGKSPSEFRLSRIDN